MKFKCTIIIVILCQVFICRESPAQVLMPSFKDTDHIKSLNGTWRFKYIPSSDIKADSSFYKTDFNVSEWADIKVPGNWEIQGFAAPMYAEYLKNGTGLYRTDFNIPQGWQNDPVYVAFDGVLYGYKVWVNGHYVGNFTSSYNRHIFDISAFVFPGRSNILAVKVVTHPKGWEFDTNDAWSLSGIFRDVTLFSLPPTHIKDITIQTFVHTKNASIDVKGIVEKTGKTSASGNLKIVGQLFDPKGKAVMAFNMDPNPLSSNSLIYKVSTRLNIDNPFLWSAEHPNRYTMRLSLKSDSTKLQQYTEHIGIREITWTNGVLRLNGSPIKLRGVTHHQLSPVNGRATTETEMKKDLKLMEKANINFIRTSHYPPDPKFLRLCDSMGFYVMDEVPFGFGEEHLEDTSYLPLLMQRASATLQRDKNRPSVIIWSVGNENPVTDMVSRVGRYVKSLDPTRPYCFPLVGSYFKKIMTSSKLDSVDILTAHYPSLSDVRQYDTLFHRPMIFSEYAHAMGTDFGRMQAIYQMIYSHPKLAGGAVWEFFDQGILRKANQTISKNESTLYAWPTPGSFYDTHEMDGMDGIVYADRTPQIDYWQVRKVYTPVKALDDTLLYEPGKKVLEIRLLNRYDFTNLSAVTCKWKLYADTSILSSGIVPLDCKPHDTVAVKIQTRLPYNPSADFYYLKLTFDDRKHYQFYERTYLLHRGVDEALILKNQSKPNGQKPIIKAGNTIVSNNYRFGFPKDSQSILLKNKDGDVIISMGPFARVGHKTTVSETAAKKRDPDNLMWEPYLLQAKKVKINLFNSHDLIMHCEYTPEVPEHRSLSGDIVFHFTDSGSIQVSYDLVPKGGGQATAAGISFVIPASLSEFRWIGRGPYAAYPGKDMLSEFGFYHLNSSDLYFPGNRQDVYCAVFSDEKGNGFEMITNKANVSVERTSTGIVVSHNAAVSSRFNKSRWPAHMYNFDDDKAIRGNFTIVPLTAAWSPILKRLFGDPKKEATIFQPFFNSYDQ